MATTRESSVEIFELLLVGDSRALTLLEKHFRRRILKQLRCSDISPAKYKALIRRIIVDVYVSSRNLSGPQSLEQGVDRVTQKVIVSHRASWVGPQKHPDHENEKLHSLIDRITCSDKMEMEAECLLERMRQAIASDKSLVH